MRIINMSDISNRLARIAISGNSNSGKTHLLFTVVDCDQCMPALYLEAAGNPHRVIGKFSNYPVVGSLDELSDLDDPYDYFAKGQPEGHKFEKTLGFRPDEPFKSIMIDGGSEIYYQFAVTEASKKGQSGKWIRGERKISDMPDVIDMPNFRRSLIQQTHQYFKFTRLPVHVFMTFLADDREDPLTKTIRRGLMLDGQVAKKVPGYFDNVGQLLLARNLPQEYQKRMLDRTVSQKDDTRVLTFRSMPNVVATNGLQLENFYVDPTISMLVDDLLKEGK